jgi:hypothetical protein
MKHFLFIGMTQRKNGKSCDLYQEETRSELVLGKRD